MNDLSLLTAAQVPNTTPSSITAQAVDRDGARRQAVAFEAVYLAQMLQPMFAGLQTDAPFGGGFGEDVWRSQQLQEFGKAIAQSGGIGLADQVARELIRAQEARQEAGR